MTHGGDALTDHGELLAYVKYESPLRDKIAQDIVKEVTGWFDGSYPIWQFKPYYMDFEWTEFTKETCCCIESEWLKLKRLDSSVEVLAPDGDSEYDVMIINFRTFRCGMMSIRRLSSPMKGSSDAYPLLSGGAHVVNDCPERDAIVNRMIHRTTSLYNGEYPLWEYLFEDQWIPYHKETCCFIETGWNDQRHVYYKVLVPGGWDDDDCMWINLKTMRCGVAPIRRRTTLMPIVPHRFESYHEYDNGMTYDVETVEDPYLIAHLSILAIHTTRTMAFIWTDELGWFHVIKDGVGCVHCPNCDVPRMHALQLSSNVSAYIRPVV